MKRFYLFALLCLTLTAVSAQVSVPRPVASGVNYSAAAGRSVMPREAGSPAGRSRVADSRLRAAELQRRAAPQKAVALSVEVDTTLCTGYTMTRNGETLRSTTVSYDKYGLRRLVATHETIGWPLGDRQMRYTYEVNADAFWTKRTIETDYCPSGMETEEGKDWYVSSIVQREMDADGRIRSVVVDNKYDNNYYEKSVYDYAHVYYDWDGKPRRGYRVEYERRWNGGEVVEKEFFRWYEPARAYLPAGSESSYNSTKVEFFADSVRTTSFYRDALDAPWRENEVVTKYYRMDGYPCEGSKICDSEGYVSGRLDVFIEAGDSVTRIYREYDRATGLWVNEQKFVSSGEMWKTPLYYNNYYSYVDGKWELMRGERVELIRSLPKVKIYKGSFNAVVYYAWFEGADAPVMLNRVDDNTYVGSDTENDITTYTYYDNDCNVKAAYRVRESVDTPLGEQSGNNSEMDVCTVWVLQPDGTWKQMDSFEYSSMGYTVRHTFNDRGYPERIILFQSNADNPVEEQRYTYTDKGYVVEYYERGVLKTRETFGLMDDGWVSDIFYRYNTSGTVTRATRNDTWHNCSRRYNWDKDTDTFTFDQLYTGDDYYTLEDGTQVSVSYEAEGDRVVPVAKHEDYNKNDDDGYSYEGTSATYRWDPVAGEWVGESRESRYRLIYDFALIYGRSDLIDSYDDHCYFDEEYISSERDPRVEVYGGATWLWDAVSKSWAIGSLHGDSVSALSANSITVVSRGGDETRTHVYERNSEGRIVRETETRTSAEAGTKNEMTTTYAYTPEGYLLTKEETENGRKTVEAYTYERRTVTLTGIAEATPSATLAIEGLSVSAPGHTVRLFNVQGAEVAAGEGSVSAPSVGLYIVRVGNASVKVVLK